MGETTAQLLQKYEDHVNPGMARLFRFLGLDTVEVRAQGVYVWDGEGDRYLDCSSGYAVMNMGHAHPRIVSAVREQLATLPSSLRVMLNQPMVELATDLAAVAPGDLSVSFVANSGAEAVEAALKLARLHSGRPGIIACRGGFHGKTLGALSVTGDDHYREPLEPLLPGVKHVPYGDAEAAAAAVDDETGALIVEPIQGEAGVILPPEGYLHDLRRLADAHDLVLIFDEIQTGMGRTGRNFACEHDGVVPDLMTLAKALGGGVMPIGAAVGRPELFSVFDRDPLIHTSTFGGHPLAARAATAAIAVLEDEKLARQAQEMGGRLQTGLQRLQRRFPEVVAEIRGRGLLTAIQATRAGAGGMLLSELQQRGMLVVPSLNNLAVMRIIPPLVIEAAQVDQALDILADSLQAVDEVVDQL